MKITKRIILLIMILLLLAACGKPEASPTPEPTATATPELPTPTPEATLPEPVALQLPPPPEHPTLYKLDLILNYYSHFASVTQQIIYTNKCEQAMSEILLLVPPRNFENSYDQ